MPVLPKAHLAIEALTEAYLFSSRNAPEVDTVGNFKHFSDQ